MPDTKDIHVDAPKSFHTTHINVGGGVGRDIIHGSNNTTSDHAPNTSSNGSSGIWQTVITSITSIIGAIMNKF